jgi:protein-S-isoprenylcysteine O-methyltransferase Ste14
VYVLGFWAPWDLLAPLDPRGPNAHLWGMLSARLAETGMVRIEAAFELLLSLGIGFAIAAAWLRTWGTAYLGGEVVHDSMMHGDAVVADGPYRYVRNPLYLGILLHTLALALLMPPSGAAFAIVMIGVVQLRLIGAEDAFLTARLRDTYMAYKARVRAVMPSLRPRIARTGIQAGWGKAVLEEIYFWGAAGSFAVAGWHYNALLLIKCVIVSLGVSLVVRGFVGTKRPVASAE